MTSHSNYILEIGRMIRKNRKKMMYEDGIVEFEKECDDDEKFLLYLQALTDDELLACRASLEADIAEWYDHPRHCPRSLNSNGSLVDVEIDDMEKSYEMVEKEVCTRAIRID